MAINQFANPTLAELRDEVDGLRQLRQQLAKRLIQAAERLEFPGVPPTCALIDELMSCRRRMKNLASNLGAEPEFGDDSVVLNDLERLVEALDYRQLTKSVMELLSDLTHVEIPDFAPLTLCQQEAMRLCELAVESTGLEKNVELELIRNQRHPLNALIRLCDDANHLSDAEWAECHDEVAATYGRQLATALTRGRIRRGGAFNSTSSPGNDSGSKSQRPQPAARASIPTAIPVVPPLAAPFAASGLEPTRIQPPTSVSPANRQNDFLSAANSRWEPPVETKMIPADSIFELPSETVFNVERVSPSSATRLRMGGLPAMVLAEAVKSEQDSPAIAPSVPNRMPPAITVQVPHEVLSSARTSDHIIQLIKDGRLPLALHLTRCIDQRAEQHDSVPAAWLLRALILGRHLSYSKGEIARQLDDELHEFRADMLLEGSGERQIAMSFLLRAAALPAALLIGSTAATGILRAIKIAPGLSQLYNYCSRIALYGDRLAGNLAEMFRPAGTIAGASVLEELGVSTQDWLHETARKVATYSRTSPLFLHAHWTVTAGTAIRHTEAAIIWSKWQETLLLASRLLKPVLDRNDADRNWVRQEVARLTSQVRVEPIGQSARTNSQNPPASRGLVLPLEEMHAVILEAVAIANRWLRLSQQSSSGGASPMPLEALELRDEVIKRSSGVLSELTSYQTSTDSPAIKAAIACCQTTIRQIQAMFESRMELPLDEPDPRHVMSADLLRIPGIELDDQWMPVADPEIVERELVAALERPELTWVQCYNHHAQSGDHETTGRLLDLNVWSNPVERESLRKLRQTQVDENRQAIKAELAELATDLAALGDSDASHENERSALRKRLERLSYELPKVANFHSFRRQVNQLQSTVSRLRTGSSMPMTMVNGVVEPVLPDAPRTPLVGPLSVHQNVIQSCDIFSGE